MANDYYDNTTNIILAATTAEAADVENKCDDIAAGFELVETDIDNTIQLTNADNTNRAIADAAGVRANKMLGFDSTGEFGNQVRRGTYKGDWTGTTYYYQDDLVRDTADALSEGAGSLFVCTVNHTSSAGMVTDTANWDVVISADDYLSTLGGTVTGDLSLTKSSPILTIKSTVGTDTSFIRFKDLADDKRFEMRFSDVLDWATLDKYAAGGTLETQLFFETDGNVSVNGAVPTEDYNLTRKDYVDDTTVALDGSRNMTGDLTINTTTSTADITLRPGLSGGTSGLDIRDSAGISRAFLAFNETNGGVSLERNSATGVPEAYLLIDSDGITCNGKVNGTSLHATNGFSGTVSSPSSITVVDGIITAMS